MDRRKRFYIIFSGAAGVLIVLLLCLNYLASTFINLELVKEHVRTAVNGKTGGKIEFTSIDLSILPLPHAVIHEADISVPGMVEGVVRKLNVYPRILPLFRGKLQFDEILITSPYLRAELPGGAQSREEAETPAAPFGGRDMMAAVLSSMAAEAPELVITVEDGNLSLDRAGETLFIFRDIEAELDLPPEELAFTMRCVSNIWSKIEIEARFDHKGDRGSGAIGLEGLELQKLTAYLFPEKTGLIGDSHVNLDLTFTADESGIVSAEAQSSLSRFTVIRNNEKVTFKGRDLKGLYRAEQGRTVVTVEKLGLDYPPLELTGELVIDDRNGLRRLDMEGRDIDAVAVRNAVLTLAGENETVEDIFTVLRGGTVPLVNVQSSGESFDDLYDFNNIVINGRLHKGNIFIPGPDLDLRNVQGEVVISKGVLKGKQLSGRFENAVGRSGTLTLGLRGGDAALYLDMKVKADLQRLPPLLRRLVNNEEFIHEVSRLKNLQGHAEGRLVLGDRLNAVKVQVDVSDMALSFDADYLPHTLNIRGGKFYFDEASVSVNDMYGTVGMSAFSDLSARLGLAQESSLEVSNAKVSLFMDEVFPWITSFERLGMGLKELGTVKGAVDIASLNLKGPLSRLEDWDYHGSGTVTSLSSDTPLFPAPVSVAKGRFEFSREKLSFTDSQVAALDASLNVSVVIDRYLEGFQKSDVTFSGDLGEKAAAWITDAVNMPPVLKLRTPLIVSQAVLNWERDTMTALKGDFVIRNGPAIDLDLLADQEGLMIKRLLIEDEESRALLSLNVREDEFKLNFKGNVTQGTRDRTFSNMPYKGWLKGDFTLRVLPDRPRLLTARGTLKGKGLVLPWKQKVPMTIDSLLLDAEGNRLNGETLLVWGGEPVFLKGFLDVDDDGFFFDMDISVEKFHWDTVKASIDMKEEGIKKDEYLWEEPVRGKIRLNADHFTFDTFTFSPLQADISFDRRSIEAEIAKADLCSISFPGKITATARELSLDFQPAAEKKELEPAFACLFDISRYMTGSYDLEAGIRAEGRKEEIVRSMEGMMNIDAADGRVYQYGLIAKVFAFINITEILRGQAPDMAEEGFAYNTITMRSDIQGSRLVLKEFVMDAASMEVAAQGYVDYMDKEVDIKVLVAPLKTVDFVLKKIPVISGIFGGTLVSIPVRVTGAYSEPEITYLSPVDVGSGLLGIMKNALQAPVKLVTPEEK